MSFYWLVVAALVVWRVTHLFQAEDGPWNVIASLRRLAGSSIMGELLDCFCCLSLWIAAPVAFAVGDNWQQRLWHWPALSAAAILLERFAQKAPLTVLSGSTGESNHVVLRQEQSSDPNHNQDQYS